jgi:hypothetical protein
MDFLTEFFVVPNLDLFSGSSEMLLSRSFDLSTDLLSGVESPLSWFRSSNFFTKLSLELVKLLLLLLELY